MGLAALFLFAILLANSSRDFDLAVFVYWVVLLAVVDASAVPHPGGTAVFTMAFPLCLAMAVIFSDQPWIPMAIVGIGAIDLREFKREIALWRAVFNRAQVMISMGGAAFVVHAAGTDLALGQRLLLLLPAAAVHFSLNFGLVTLAVHIAYGWSFRESLEMTLPRPRPLFALSQSLFVLLGGACAVIYLESPYGMWLVPTMLIPLFFARLSLLTGQRQVVLANELADKQKALLVATDNVFRERESERTRIAEEIHDTTLQHLAGVSLMVRKARHALNATEFADVDKALDAAATSANESLDSLRQSVMDLRRSQLESEDLQTAVKEFVDNVQTLWDVPVDVQWKLSSNPPVPVALAAFQVIHEGVINALKHSESTSIAIRAEEDNGSIRISVEDNGRGFDPIRLDVRGHLGIELMLKRAAAVGGELAIDSTPNECTRILLTVPTTG